VRASVHTPAVCERGGALDLPWARSWRKAKRSASDWYVTTNGGAFCHSKSGMPSEAIERPATSVQHLEALSGALVSVRGRLAHAVMGSGTGASR